MKTRLEQLIEKCANAVNAVCLDSIGKELTPGERDELELALDTVIPSFSGEDKSA